MPTPEPLKRRKVKGYKYKPDEDELKMTYWYGRELDEWSGLDILHYGVMTEAAMKKLGWTWKERDENLLWPAGSYVEYGT